MRLTVIIGMVTAIALTGLGWRTYALNLELTLAQRMIATLSASIASRDTVINRLQRAARQRDQQETALRENLSQASQQSLSREQKIQRLRNENKALRDWFATALPADVIRLHQRPAFTTAGDYLRWLSDSNALPDTGQQPSGKR